MRDPYPVTIAQTINSANSYSAAGSLAEGTPFTVTASGASLNAPSNTQFADQVKADAAILDGIGLSF